MWVSVAARVLDGQPAVVHVDDLLVKPDVDAELLELPRGARGEFRPEHRQHRVERVDEHDAGLAGVDGAELLDQRAVRELGDLAGELDARGARADDDEGQPFGAGRLVGLQFGELERGQDPAADLERVVDRLQAGRVRLEGVVAEVGGGRAGGDDQ